MSVAATNTCKETYISCRLDFTVRQNNLKASKLIFEVHFIILKFLNNIFFNAAELIGGDPHHVKVTRQPCFT